LALAIGIAVSAILMVLAFHGVSGLAVREALAAADLRLIAPFLVALFLYYWVKTVRWVDLLSPIARTAATAMFPPVMIGYAGSALLPLQLGELARAYIAAQRLNAPGMSVLMSIALERVFDLLSILLLLGIALALGEKLPPVLVSAGYAIAALALVAIGFVLVYVYRTEAMLAFTSRMVRILPARVAQLVLRQVQAGVSGLHALREPRLLVRVLCTSLLQWLFMWLCVWLSLIALGIDATALATFVVLVLMIIGISLPNSPGYVGSIQLAYVLGLKPLGIDPALAIAASVFFHVLAYLSVVLAGLFCLQRLGIGLSGLRTAWRNPAGGL
jgi:uncharacterized protein (TIRG00374 family)